MTSEMSPTPTEPGAIDLTATAWPADPTDKHFGEPFIDVDEWRDAPVSHRYVHGGFRDTDTLFSFYFPDADRYEGRFFQHVTPVPQNENLAQDPTVEHNKITFSVESGAYFVETNGGGPDAANPMSGMDPTIGAYKANAASAQFSRMVAAALYGPHRAYGYLYGGSGGGYRTIGAAENTTGVWDGFAPYVIGSSMAIPNVFSVRMHAQRILRHKFPDIVEAYDVGGDPSTLDLTPEEASAFEEVTRMGFPPRSWFAWQKMGMHAFSVLYPGVMMADATYGTDFWTAPGYLGSDPESSVHADRVRLETTIVERIESVAPTRTELTAGGVDESYQHTVPTASGVSSLRLAEIPDGWMLGAQLFVHSGSVTGAVIQLAGVDGDTVTVEPGQEQLAAGIAIGDEVTLDNSNFLAVQTYHRHQVPGPDYAVWDQFRDENAEPVYPQRPMLLGPLLSRGASGTLQSGDYDGKMILVGCLLDREAFPWQSDWYRKKVTEHLGDAETESFRLWYIDNATHGEDDQDFPARTVEYVGALETALRQLAAWVEKGIDPAPTTEYEVVDGQVRVPKDASDRHGVQPTVQLRVNGKSSTTVAAGDIMQIRVDVQAPAGAIVHEIIPVHTSDDGDEKLGRPLTITPGTSVSAEWTETFLEPGRTHYLAVRVSAQTGGDAADPHARVYNVARARVDVLA